MHNLWRYVIGGGAISVAACVVLVMVLESLLGTGGLELLVVGLLFALPGIVVGSAIWLCTELKGKNQDGDGNE